MPNKLTDTEIKKALEVCIDGYCRGCCYGDTDQRHCRDDLMQEALDLINRLEGENEKNENIIRVADKTIETLNAEIRHLDQESDILRADVENLNRICDEVNAENESLKAEIERLNKSINLMKGAKCVYSYDGETLEFCTTSPCPISKTVDQIKTEAYKEFANELKCRTHEISYNTMQVVNNDDIDNLYKELVGDGDGKRKD